VFAAIAKLLIGCVAYAVGIAKMFMQLMKMTLQSIGVHYDRQIWLIITAQQLLNHYRPGSVVTELVIGMLRPSPWAQVPDVAVTVSRNHHTV
jgi:hypothetical protein